MAHLLPIRKRDSIAELRQAIKRSDNEAQKTRIRAIIALKEGKTRTAVAKSLVVSRTSVISWIALYNKGGTDALVLGVGGRPEGNPVWDARVFDDLAKEIDKGGYWSIPRMQEWLTEHKRSLFRNRPSGIAWINWDIHTNQPVPIQRRGIRKRRMRSKKGACSIRGAVEEEGVRALFRR